MNHPFSNVLVGGHSTVPDASVQEECRMIDLPDCLPIVGGKVTAAPELVDSIFVRVGLELM
jgi:hypothetical protein